MAVRRANGAEPLLQIQKVALPRLEEARSERAHIEPYVNDVLAYGRPGARMMGEKRSTPVDNGEQQRIYDSELQITMNEAASELKAIYTPFNRNWAKLAPRISLDEAVAGNEEVIAAINAESNKLFEAMRMTRLDMALDLAWEDWEITAGGLQITKAPRARVTLVEYWPLPEMYMEACGELPTGVDGRWRVRDIKRRYLAMTLGMVDWEDVLKSHKRASNANSGEEAFEIAYGYRYDGEGWPAERWIFEVFFEGKLVHSKPVLGEGAVGLIPFRSGENPPSAWGRGPASIALSPARALDQIAYLVLKVLPKRVDPPMWYVMDGQANFEQGILAGEYIPVGPDFQMGPIESTHGLDDLYTEVETLRRMVKRPLWQDRPDPYEAGSTPPTAYQIQNEELGRAIRQERPRSRINPELIHPVLARFIRIESDAKRMAPIKVDGIAAPIILEPRSPMSRAADLEDVQQAQMLLQMIAAYMGDRGLMSVDMRTTIHRIQQKLGEGAAELVALLDPTQGALETAVEEGARSAGAEAGAQVGASVGGPA